MTLTQKLANQPQRAAWLKTVAGLTHKLSLLPQQNWLLFEAEVQPFSVMFFALLCARKHIVLPPSATPGQLTQLKPFVDATIGSGVIEGLTHISSDEALKVSLEHNTEQLLLDDSVTVDFFTSGSTGDAKKISKTWAQLNREICDLEDLWSEQLSGSEIVATVSHQHIYGLIFKLLWPLLFGRTINEKSVSYPEELALLLEMQLEKNQSLTLVSSPAFLARTSAETLWQAHKDQFDCLFSSGGPLSLASAAAIEQQLGFAPIEILGSTETGGMAWRQQTGVTPHLWQPFDKVKVRVEVDSNRLQIQSPYLTNMDWYTCDDRIELNQNGQFALLNRADRTVKIEEKRLSLDELENTLCKHNWVEQCRALIISGKRDQIAVAAVLTDAGKKACSQYDKRHINTQLKHHLSHHFEAVLLPRKWRYPKQMPINSQGKLLHQQITSLFE